MQKNDIITLTIESITNEGSGVGRVADFVVFVPFAAVGDHLRVKLLKVNKTYAYGKIEEIVSPSSDRIASDCPVFTKCGGCDFRHLSYEAELRAKADYVKTAFQKIGNLNPTFLPIIENPSPLRYRNKSQFPIQKDKSGKTVYGFYRIHSHDVVPCGDCLLQPKRFTEIMDKLIGLADESKISIYDESRHEGVLRHVQIRGGHYERDILVTIIAKRNVPEFKHLARKLGEAFADIAAISVNVNRNKTNVIFDFSNDEITLYQKSPNQTAITDTMCGNSVSISPKTFYQINTPVAEVIYKSVGEFLQPEGKTIFDLFCGIGTISLMLAKTAAKVFGVDIVPDSIENATENAKRSGAANTEFIAADAIDGLNTLIARGITPDAVVLNPARKGCTAALLDRLAEASPQKIAMVSCNPATAARDCAILESHGYKVESVQGADMFSRTRHVETVCLMSKVEG